MKNILFTLLAGLLLALPYSCTRDEISGNDFLTEDPESRALDRNIVELILKFMNDEGYETLRFATTSEEEKLLKVSFAAVAAQYFTDDVYGPAGVFSTLYQSHRVAAKVNNLTRSMLSEDEANIDQELIIELMSTMAATADKSSPAYYSEVYTAVMNVINSSAPNHLDWSDRVRRNNMQTHIITKLLSDYGNSYEDQFWDMLDLQEDMISTLDRRIDALLEYRDASGAIPKPDPSMFCYDDGCDYLNSYEEMSNGDATALVYGMEAMIALDNDAARNTFIQSYCTMLQKSTVAMAEISDLNKLRKMFYVGAAAIGVWENEFARPEPPMDYSMSISVSARTLEATGGSFNMNIVMNDDRASWYVVDKSEGISSLPTKGTGTKSVKISAGPNYESGTQTRHITFAAENDPQNRRYKCTITQSKIAFEYFVADGGAYSWDMLGSISYLRMLSEKGGQYVIDVKTNTRWSATVSESDCSAWINAKWNSWTDPVNPNILHYYWSDHGTCTLSYGPKSYRRITVTFKYGTSNKEYKISYQQGMPILGKS